MVMIMSLEPVIMMFPFLEITEISHFNHSTAFVVSILFHFLDLYNANLIIFALVSIADFEKMNQEIIKFGHPLNLPKGFEFVPPEK